jgi:hypothetical protein
LIFLFSISRVDSRLTFSVALVHLPYHLFGGGIASGQEVTQQNPDIGATQ